MSPGDALRGLGYIVAVGAGWLLGYATARGKFEVPDDWETLFVGILAVAAAAITVQQMQRSDLLQEARHRGDQEHERTKDRLRILRAARASRAELLAVASQMEKLVNIAEPYERAGGLDAMARHLKRSLDGRALSAARDIFDPETETIIQTLWGTAASLAKCAEVYSEMLVKDHPKIQDAWNHSCFWLELAPKECRKLAEALEVEAGRLILENGAGSRN